MQLPATAVPRIVEEFSGDFYLEEAAVRAVYEPPHQFNAIDTRSVTVREGKIRPGDNVLLAALGGGFAWGAAMIKW